jgi:FkbM family methyltransferase
MLTQTPLGLWPVRVRAGIAAQARWTLYPWTSYWRGTHEPAVQAAVLAMIGSDIRGWACWDLGAHYGIYSIGLARRVGPSGQVAAFEPNPVSFARLARHRRMNRLPWLKLYPAAASDTTGTAELLTHGDLTTTTTHLLYDGELRVPASAPIAVRSVRLDDLVDIGELRLPRIVKIDVEGHGHHALSGMAQALSAARPIVFIAFHSPQERAGALAVLEALGYTAQPIGREPALLGDFCFSPRD